MATIKRIIKRNGRVVQKRKRYIRCKYKKQIFPDRHNNSQDWKYRKINREAIPQRRIPRDFEIDTNNFPLTVGEVHFMRQVKENGIISALNEDFSIE
ncbi:hypothetical protein DRO03_01215 [Methanosarcinales archaeon]|nr:MAG: hypothetical protein DRO03_01215 [Methanosarcinales archaeon]